jgi:hypothetical protein
MKKIAVSTCEKKEEGYRYRTGTLFKLCRSPLRDMVSSAEDK